MSIRPQRYAMAEKIARFLLLLLLALLAGTMFGIWIGFNPMQLSADAYVEQQQNAIRSLNTLMPAMGATCVLLCAFLAVLSKGKSRGRYMLMAAIALLLVAAMITRFVNQPINAIVITWNPQAPPAEWFQLREQWWQWHVVRTAAAIGALVLAVLEALSRRASSEF